jgi:hypothetical protein
MRRIIVVVAGILALTAGVFALRDRPHSLGTPLPSSVPDLASRLNSQQEALNSLQEKVDHLAKLIESVAANHGGPQALRADSPDSLEHKLSSLSGRVDSLGRQLADVARYGEQIDRSLLGIDMKMSTPTVLNNKLDRLQKGLKP